MDKYRTLAANTALISIGTFASKFLLFFMVRFYTAYLSPSDYGTADLITQTANLVDPGRFVRDHRRRISLCYGQPIPAQKCF